MKDLRTLLPNAAREEIKKEALRMLNELTEDHEVYNIYGELKTYWKVNVLSALKDSYDYISFASLYSGYFDEVWPSVVEEFNAAQEEDRS